MNLQRFESIANPPIVGMFLLAIKNQLPAFPGAPVGGTELNSRLVETDVLPAGSDRARSRSLSLRRISVMDWSAHEVGLGKVDHFVAASAQYSANHIEAEAQGLFKTDGRRHR